MRKYFFAIFLFLVPFLLIPLCFRVNNNKPFKSSRYIISYFSNYHSTFTIEKIINDFNSSSYLFSNTTNEKEGYSYVYITNPNDNTKTLIEIESEKYEWIISSNYSEQTKNLLIENVGTPIIENEGNFWQQCTRFFKRIGDFFIMIGKFMYLFIIEPIKFIIYLLRFIPYYINL